MTIETKVKEISGRLGRLDVAVNNWLSVNSNIMIIDMKYSIVMDFNQMSSAVLIIYKEGD